MYLERKIDAELLKWKSGYSRKPLLLRGARQVGKSSCVRHLHNSLIQEFRDFLVVGGMPASVVAWLNTHDYAQCAEEQEDIQQTYYDDFSKYAAHVDPQLLRNTLQSVVTQVGRKFVFSNVEGGYRSEEVKNALTMLCDAGIIKEVSHTAANGLPLGAEVNRKFRKYIYLDSGLLLRVLDLDLTRARHPRSIM